VLRGNRGKERKRERKKKKRTEKDVKEWKLTNKRNNSRR